MHQIHHAESTDEIIALLDMIAIETTNVIETEIETETEIGIDIAIFVIEMNMVKNLTIGTGALEITIPRLNPVSVDTDLHVVSLLNTAGED